MNDLVFLDPNRLDAEPFTTSDVIAANAQTSHHAVQQMISKHEDDIKEFGLLAFEMRAVKKARGVKYEKIYHLNEEQATLLITYLQNTPPVRKFKKDLVREFYRMRQELTQRQINRSLGKPIRRTLTDAVQGSGEDERMHGHAYSTYTDLAYKWATGKIARILRTERGAARQAVAADFLTAAEMERYNVAEGRITVLLDMGLQYDKIKELMMLRIADAKAG